MSPALEVPPYRMPTLSLLLLAIALAAPASAQAGPAGEGRAAAPAPPPEQAAFELAPCEVPGFSGEGRCGTFPVYEDRDAGAGRVIGLKVVVIPATGEAPARHAVTFISGGPGDGSTGAAGGVAAAMAELRGERDLLFVDLRGTGGSHRLRCPYQDDPERPRRYLHEFMALGRLAECRDALSRDADLTLYTTPYAVDDLDDVRAALGYESLDLVGVSYGSRAAQVYARRHPERARTLSLLGPVPTDAAMPLHMARDTDAALFGTLAACAADPACAAAFPDLEADLRQALARLEANVEPVEVAAPDGEGTVAIPMSRAVFVQAVRYMLYNPSSQMRVPFTVHRAAQGDFAPAASVAAFIGKAFNSAADGLYLSVTCAEDLPRFTLEEGRERAAGTVLGEYRVNQQKAACALWPRGRLPEGFHQPVSVPTPTLLVVGELDPASPPRWARQIAAHLPNSVVVEVPGAGHSTDGMSGGECVPGLPVEVIRSGSVAGVDPACAAGARLPGWVLEGEGDPIELPEDALREVAGSYASPEGLSLTIELVEGRLRLRIGVHDLALTPLAPHRFRVDGAPPGFAVETVRDAEGRVTAVVLEEGPGSRTEVVRQEPPGA